MDQATSSGYRKRLLPFIVRWTQRNMRVAIFGTGPHTDYLFDVLPELNNADVVGYLDSNKDRQGKLYKRKKIYPLNWASDNADVILCSSFVNEASMAAAVEHLDCKVVTTHTPPVDSCKSDAEGERRPPTRLSISWPDSMSSKADGCLEELRALSRCRRQVLGYFSKAAVLDSILEECFPFIRIADTDPARAVLRYVLPGSSVFEVRAASRAVTRLARFCSGPEGKVFAIQAQYPLDALTVGSGMDEADSASLQFAWMKDECETEDRAHWNKSVQRNLTRLGGPQTRGVDWRDAFPRAVSEFIRSRLPSHAYPVFIRIEDESIGLSVLRELHMILVERFPTLLFRLELSRWNLGFRDLFQFLTHTGYEMMSLEEDYRLVDARHYDSERRFGWVNILAVRVHEWGHEQEGDKI